MTARPPHLKFRMVPDGSSNVPPEALVHLDGWRALLTRHWNFLVPFGLFAGIATDVLKPLYDSSPNLILNCALLSAVLGASLLVAAISRAKWAKRCAFPCSLAFVAALTLVLVFLAQKMTGNTASGAISAVVPSVEEVQRKLGIFEKKLDVIEAGVGAANNKIDASRADIAEVLRIVSKQESVPLTILRAILAEMGELTETLDPGGIAQKLTVKASEFKALTDRLNRLSGADPEVLRLRQEAVEALGKGRFSQADAHLAAAEARDLAGLEALEAFSQQKRLSAAESRAERAAAAKLRTNPEGYREAANHFGEAARIAQAADARVERYYKHQKGLTLIDLGNEFGLNEVITEAIEHFQNILKTINRSDNALDWAATQNRLGNALSIFGEREDSNERLEKAVLAYRSALEEWTRESAPNDWAGAHTNLGLTLRILGQREIGTTRIEEAIKSYRLALEQWTRERTPNDWAGAQHNLGTALRILGERESEKGRLKEAVASYRLALEEIRRETVPLRWAMTQSGLGNALQTLGMRETGTEHLKEAVAAYRLALEEQKRDRVPLQWAGTQHNLGSTLTSLGEREGETGRLKEAVAAYRAALEEQKRDRVPLQWAGTQNSLGTALVMLGALEGGTARLQEGVISYIAALEVYRRDNLPLQWAMTKGNQGVAMRVIAERDVDSALAKQALGHIEMVLEVFQQAHHARYVNFFEWQAEETRALIADLEFKAAR